MYFSEVSQLTFSDITWTDLGFDIFIAKSKTDQTCTLTHRYLSALQYTSGFIMPSMKRNRPDQSSPLSYSTALRDLRSALSSIGIDPSGYGEHSGRRGGTTAAASKDATVNELMLQGRWRSESMPRLYTDNAFKSRRKFARRLATF